MPAAPAGCPALPPLSQRTDFVRKGLDFACRHRADAAFRFLKIFLQSPDEELEMVMGKIYCDALPAVYGRPESLLQACWKSFLQPFYYAAKKEFFWRKSQPADFDFETVDWPYFTRWYAPVCGRIGRTRRVTPSSSTAQPGPQAPAPMDSSLRPRSLALLLAAPLFIPSLLKLSLHYGLNLIASYRKALGLYALFDGHFRRYPCRHFVTYADDSNHPCRYLAFKRNCGGRMSVVQNGERTHHPAYAFGMMDYYLAFGPYIESLAPQLHMRLRQVVPIGALYLNSRRDLAQRKAEALLYDILFIDQTIWPYNEFDKKAGRSLERIFQNLNTLKRRRPGLRIAYQLRVYKDQAQKEKVLETLARFFTEKIDILENNGDGESYENILRCRLVMTFNSTMGYEAFFLGKKTIFVNYAGSPYEIYSDDPRFQIYDEAGGYDNFEKHVEDLLALEWNGIPEEIKQRHAYFDGRVQERMADFFSGEDFR